MTSDTVPTTTTVDRLADALTHVLGEDHSAGTFTADTLLFGSLPELDSLALVELITVIEERFDFDMDEDDITAEVFESVGSLSAYIDRQSS
ncbi:phosphopantetheine-binding protein [Nocardioides sp. CER19]|uniref:acyl carrier protein n=1 Tax=Nocardioides sp. CER19 TaxID=3038538 RepID=UPI0024488BC9|nr:phosphopantetheine-binding protein [Nocardioides sp. CER19]MDH2414833.1 phosphopantetheine-binding protein [Nocardioides sp. CER19]